MLIVALLLAAEPSPCVEWGRRFAMGGDDEVVKQTTSSELPCAKYLRARSLMRLAQPETQREALTLFTELAGSQPAPLGEWAAAYAAQAAFHAGEPTTVKAPEAPFVGAEQAVLWDAAARSPADPNALARLSQKREKPALERLRASIALEVAKRLPVGAPTPSWVQEARRVLFVEFPDDDAAPMAHPEATLDDLMRRAEVATEKHMNADVLKTVEAAFKMPDVAKDDRCKLTFWKGAALRKQRKYALSEEALTEAAKLCNGLVGDFYKRASFLLAQVQVISRPLEVAEKTLKAFAEQFAGDTLVDDVLFLLAVSLEKAQRFKDAEQMYDRIGKIDPPGDKCGEARFRAAYARYKDARFKEALPLFVDIASGRRCSDEYERTRGLYWESRTRDRLKQKPAEIRKPLDTIVGLAPLTYYGLMAQYRSKKPIEFKLPNGPIARPMGALLATREAQRSLALSQLGLYLEARDELAPLEPRLSNDGERAAFADLLGEAFDPYHSHLLARTSLKDRLGAAPDATSVALWHLAYPRPFTEVAAAERAEDLPTDLLLALIREESAFMMQVGSWANAYGLTQLLVETAEMTAKDMKLGRKVTASDLRSDAALAIRLGGHHVAMLRRKFTSPPLWLAAYNSGAGNVDKWVKARGDKPLDEFIEEIPLDETRGYVKRILRSWAVYRVLSGRPVAEISLSLR